MLSVNYKDKPTLLLNYHQKLLTVAILNPFREILILYSRYNVGTFVGDCDTSIELVRAAEVSELLSLVEELSDREAVGVVDC